MPKITKAGGPSNIDDPDATPVSAVRSYARVDDGELARAAYGAYGQARDWTTRDGGAKRAWSDQDDKERAAWLAAATAVRHRIQEPAGAGPIIDGPPDDDESEVGSDEQPDDDAGHGDAPVVEPDAYPPYPQDGTAREVSEWVAGDVGRAREALAYERSRPGGARAGLSAELSRLAEPIPGQA